MSRGLVMSTMFAANCVKESVAVRGEDVVERQRREGDFLAFLAGARKPVAHLLEVGEEVAVREDGALGNAGRAARVLQEGDVGVVDLMGGEAVAAADLKRFR